MTNTTQISPGNYNTIESKQEITRVLFNSRHFKNQNSIVAFLDYIDKNPAVASQLKVIEFHRVSKTHSEWLFTQMQAYPQWAEILWQRVHFTRTYFDIGRLNTQKLEIITYNDFQYEETKQNLINFAKQNHIQFQQIESDHKHFHGYHIVLGVPKKLEYPEMVKYINITPKSIANGITIENLEEKILEILLKYPNIETIKVSQGKRKLSQQLHEKIASLDLDELRNRNNASSTSTDSFSSSTLTPSSTSTETAIEELLPSAFPLDPTFDVIMEEMGLSYTNTAYLGKRPHPDEDMSNADLVTTFGTFKRQTTAQTRPPSAFEELFGFVGPLIP